MYLTGWVAAALWFSGLVSHLPAWLHSTRAMRSFVTPVWGGDLVYIILNVLDRITVALWFSDLVNSSDWRHIFSCLFQSPDECGAVSANKSVALVASYLCVPAENDNSCSIWLQAWHWLVLSIQWLRAWLVRFTWTHRLTSVIRSIRKFDKFFPCMGITWLPFSIQLKICVCIELDRQK